MVGLARSGKAAALALAARGETVTGVDSGSPEDLEELAAAGIECVTGTSGVEQLERVRTLVKSPGVPSDAEVILEAERLGLEVIGELELGWRLVPGRIVAITGTNGKTTTTELATHIFRRAGRPVEPAGNVGHPLCGLAPGPGESLPEDLTVICECSSFQLEDTSAFAPEVAVLLNITPDHLDRHGDLAAYRQAKLRVFENQGDGDVAVVNAGEGVADVTPATGAATIRFTAEPEPARRQEPEPGTPAAGLNGSRAAGSDAHGPSEGAGPAGPDGRGSSEDPSPGGLIDIADGRIRVDGEPLVETGALRIRGRHNVANAMAAAGAALACGVPSQTVAAALRDFVPLPHRFEPVGEIEGVDFINDSKATNVEATLAALGSFDGGVHLILGGSRKQEPFDRLVPAVRQACRGIYLIGETADEIGEALAPAGIGIVRYCEDLEAAVSEAAGAATPGETVLLSPACASFDQFRDYEHRGDVFRELVKEFHG